MSYPKERKNYSSLNLDTANYNFFLSFNYNIPRWGNWRSKEAADLLKLTRTLFWYSASMPRHNFSSKSLRRSWVTNLLENSLFQYPTLPHFLTIFPTKRSLNLNFSNTCTAWPQPKLLTVIHWNYSIAASFLFFTSFSLFFF